MEDRPKSDLVPAPDTAAAPPEPDFDAVLADLKRLSIDHLLFFRVNVGRTSSFAFFRNDRERYYDQAPNKAAPLRRFCQERARELADLGLNEDLLRKSILAWFVVEDLPPDLLQHLYFSHVVALARVPDASTRLVLAQATVDNRWNGDALADAIAAAARGAWIDAEPEKPGLQPPPQPPEPEKAVATGRVVTRFEKSVSEWGDLSAQWDAVPVEKLTATQAKRMDASLAQLEAHVARVRARLRQRGK